MKKVLFSLFVLAVVDVSAAPKMQATIRYGNDPLTVDVYMKSSVDFSQRDENVTLTIALPASITPSPLPGSSGNMINSIGPVTRLSGLQPVFLTNNLPITNREVVVTKHDINGISYNIYTIFFLGTAELVHSWHAGVEQKIFSISFNGCTGNCSPETLLLISLPKGGPERFSYWYFQSNVLGDITNYQEPFYANEQTGPAVNGGSSDGSALSYVSLKPAASLVQSPSLNVYEEGCNVKMNWSEINSAKNTIYYAVERSADNARYTAVSKVIPNGTVTSYSAIDNTALPGKNYYRLCVADASGRLTYSAVQEVRVTCTVKPVVLVTPTLGNGLINVQLAPGFGYARLKVVNSFGVQVLSDDNRSNNRKLDLTRAGKGAYIIAVINDAKVVETVKVIVL